MTAEIAPESFWSFATTVYARAGMSAACLSLQDRLGADVNILLFCLWLAAYERRSFLPRAKQALELSRLWQNTALTPLRSCRRALAELIRTEAPPEFAKADLNGLRESVKAAELAAEKLEIEALARLVSNVPGGGEAEAPSAALANLRSYFSTAGLHLDPLGESEVLRIVALAFSG